MKPKELRAYKSVIKQGLSVREAEQIFNLPVSTTYPLDGIRQYQKYARR